MIDQTKIKIISYNCNSLRKNIDLIRMLLGKCDVLLLQEIILLECDLDIISQISDQINFIARPSRIAHSNTSFFRWSAIIWSKSLNIDISLKLVKLFIIWIIF